MSNIEVINYLDELFPNPKCELIYNKDYELLIAVALSAQTTDKKVNEVTKVLFDKYKDLESIKNANVNDIKEILKPIGTYNKKSQYVIDIASFLLNNCNGVVPNNRKLLESINGVGRKTTNVVLAELFNEPVIAVDTHVSRVSKRLGYALKDDSVLDVEKKLVDTFPGDKLVRIHHQFVLFGRYYCKSINPKCSNCSLKNICKKNRI